MKNKKSIAPPPLLFTVVAIPYLTGVVATSYGRKFWPWFFLGILLPVLSIIIVVFMPDKSKTLRTQVVENEELFDHLFLKNGRRKEASRSRQTQHANN